MSESSAEIRNDGNVEENGSNQNNKNIETIVEHDISQEAGNDPLFKEMIYNNWLARIMVFLALLISLLVIGHTVLTFKTWLTVDLLQSANIVGMITSLLNGLVSGGLIYILRLTIQNQKECQAQLWECWRTKQQK